MTKHYHLTPEHIVELAKELDKSGANIALFTRGDVEVFGSKVLQQLINAALDEVLGEPVAEITENILWGKDIRWLVDLPVVGTKLYAPKELT